MKVLVTGAAGFIGMPVSLRLLAEGHCVVGLDNLNDYYAVSLKESRLALLTANQNFQFIRMDVADRPGITGVFAAHAFDRVVHLAAQAGVRYSLQNPLAYVDSNLVGFANILEGCRHHHVEHLVYASSSSVYGGNTKMPFSEDDNVDHPVSLYAATKKANELMAHTYSHLYQLPTTGLRFFTVYGPWGRPDMAPYLFTRAILAGEAIKVFNHGQMQRDFTYIDDIVEGVIRVLHRIPKAGPDTVQESDVPYRLFNIGNHTPIPLLEFIDCLEKALGKTAQKHFLPMQDGDVPATFADTQALQAWVGFAPSTPLQQGVNRFVDWYRGYHCV